MTEEVKSKVLDDINEAVRWTVRSRRLLLGGGIDGRVVEDTRTSLGIIEKYLVKAIARIESNED